ncbi:SDR family oxidoreductase [Alicyclobacillus herbarius]|uniref:SDR family oxidoreductase n=1 Tax=Alicyclobacillus herbarius TaxID=122960 RepID=UPI0003FCC726|nr:SDR family oxidoreductase [Alicyclobacillus herbarius]
MAQTTSFPKVFPAQHQDRQPGLESMMNPLPVAEDPNYKAAGKLTGRVALITGGDSGIGRAVAIAFAKEGADVGIVYLDEQEDAQATKARIEQLGRRCVLEAGDVGQESFCQNAVNRIVKALGRLDVLVNNAAEQHPQDGIEKISAEQLERTFRTNIFSYFYMTKASLPYLGAGSSIINTTSVTAYEGNAGLIDYSSTKGAIVTFTRSLSLSLAGRGIRVNGVAPGPIWTPLIPSTSPTEQVPHFGSNTPMQRAGQPCELAPAYVYLASNDSSYVSGQVLHVNGGTVVNG